MIDVKIQLYNLLIIFDIANKIALLKSISPDFIGFSQKNSNQFGEK